MVAPSGSGGTSISLPTFALPLLAHVTSLLVASSRSPPPASPTVGGWAVAGAKARQHRAGREAERRQATAGAEDGGAAA